MALLSHLDEIARIVGADRVAAVWVDEYGPGLVHPHAVLDLLTDRPRRSFPAEPLRRAWERGVPGVFESVGPVAGHARDANAAPWSLAVALGSDGTRAWFVVAESVTVRGALGADLRDRVMFLAGECSSVVLHRDLDASATGPTVRPTGRFAGWSVLQDLEDRDPDSDESRVISLRFVVARLPRLLVEDDLTVPVDRLRQQADRARDEIDARSGGIATIGAEAGHWEEVLDAYASGELGRLGPALVAWAESVEAQGHRQGALELYQTAYDIAAGCGDLDVAIEAARLAGRCLRRQSRWDEAHALYDRARGVAEAGGFGSRVALVLDGVATIHRERGNLPAARATLLDGLEHARASGDDLAVARVHHGFMGLEHSAGNLDAAVEHGWQAVSLYRDDTNRVRGLAGLAAAFQEQGQLDPAEDAWMLVRHLSSEDYYQRYAVDALSHISALRGDAAMFARRAAELDAMGWETGPASAKAEVLLYRGLSHRALGRIEEARQWLHRAVAFAETNGFNRTLFEAEKALGTLDADREAPPATPMHTASEVAWGVAQELSCMRRELTGAPA